MEPRKRARFVNDDARERDEELIGVLMAISIVSKRLATRLMDFEHKREARGEKYHVTRQSPADR